MHRGVYLVGPLETPLSARGWRRRLPSATARVLSHDSAAGAVGACARCGTGRSTVTAPGRKTRAPAGHRACIAVAGLHSRRDIRRQAPSRSRPRPAPSWTSAPRSHTRELERATRKTPRCSGASQLHSLNEQFRALPDHRGAAALTQGHRSSTRRSPAREAERRLPRADPGRAATRAGGQTRTSTATRSTSCGAAQLLIVEVDGYAFHSSRSAFERDRRTDRNR